jgi:selenocysteine lyase/cysteine desulfurase
VVKSVHMLDVSGHTPCVEFTSTLFPFLTGEVADLDAIVAAAEHHGATTLVDAT